MLRLDMRGHDLERAGKHGRVVGIADDGKRGRDQVVRHYEIDDRADEYDFYIKRGMAVEGAVMGGQQFFEERQIGRLVLDLAPEFAAQLGLVGGDAARCPDKVLPGET